MLCLENLRDHYDESVDGHWMWTGRRAGENLAYGQVTYQSRQVFAHRAVYELLVGPIPHGHVIDHLCRVRLCVNPEHLEAVTQRENILRGAKSFRLTGTCRRGHDVSLPGRLVVEGDGRQRCRVCRRAKEARRRRVAA